MLLTSDDITIKTYKLSFNLQKKIMTEFLWKELISWLLGEKTLGMRSGQ